MTNDPKSNIKYDIHKRIFDFVTRVLKLTQALPKTAQNIILINQITRSVTSIGANDQEADGATSSRQFFNSYTIVKKETQETNYWLKVIFETNLRFQRRMSPLMDEGQQIEAIISSIVMKHRAR